VFCDKLPVTSVAFQVNLVQPVDVGANDTVKINVYKDAPIETQVPRALHVFLVPARSICMSACSSLRRTRTARTQHA
jgi:hypothetical protein